MFRFENIEIGKSENIFAILSICGDAAENSITNITKKNIANITAQPPRKKLSVFIYDFFDEYFPKDLSE